MHKSKRVISTVSFTEINYGDKVNDYNGQTWIFAGVMGKEVIVSLYGTNNPELYYPSIFDLMIIE